MRKWGPLLAVCLGTFMLLLDVTITVVALPDISQELHTSASALAWVMDGYALALAAALLTLGTVADRHGQRRVYLVGLAVFTLASLLCGLAPSAIVLIAMRIVQGLGAAAMFATSLSLLRTTYTGRDRAAALGTWGAVASAAAALGPLAGGVLTQVFGWGWIFFVNIPVGVLAVVLTLRLVPAPVVRASGERGRVDVPGMLLFAAFASGLLYAMIRAHEGGWTSPGTLVPLVVAVLALIAFVLVQRRTTHPLLDLALLRRPVFLAALVAIFVGEFTAYGFMAYTSVWLQSLTGLSPMGAGLVMLPSSAASMVVALLAGRLLHRVAARYSLPLGLLLVAAGAFAQSFLTASSAGLTLLAGMVLSGIGMGMVIPQSSHLAVEAVPQERAGMASGAFTTFQQLGYALGVAIFGTLVASAAQSTLTGHVADAHAASQQLTGGSAHQLLDQAPAGGRQAMDHLLRTAFTHGLNTVAVIGGLLAVAAALFCAVALRRQARGTAEAQADARSRAARATDAVLS
ncbi:MFS transporter [Streptomyces monticola]|uniref:MFS transporter n=1 Tax=Streptomyces monticola TaxID=2666263 RepID=A0ABW2JAV0_9ACTN